MVVRCGWGFVRYGTCWKHRSTSLPYRGKTSVTCETGIGFRKGVLRMRIVICHPAHIPSTPTRGVYTIQLSLLQVVNINCTEKSYFDTTFILCPNFLHQRHFLKALTISFLSQGIFWVIMDGYESILKFPNRFTEYKRQPPNIFGYKGCRLADPI